MNLEEMLLAKHHLDSALNSLDLVGTLIDDSADANFQETRNAIAMALFSTEKAIERQSMRGAK